MYAYKINFERQIVVVFVSLLFVNSFVLLLICDK